jgi:hypothetical protein
VVLSIVESITSSTWYRCGSTLCRRQVLVGLESITADVAELVQAG